MSPEAQRIAIAEACGWKGPFVKEWLREYDAEGGDVWAFCGTDPNGERAPVPCYFTDLNAMHEAHESLPAKEHATYRWRLQHIVYNGPAVDGNKHRSTSHATAAQRAEAFLRTIGKWEEPK